MKQQEDKCCGNCCWFKHEDTDGWGMCYSNRNQYLANPRHCSDASCNAYISRQTMRHHLAVLICHNRWRRDNHVPSIYKMQDPKEIGKAIDFVIDYIKTFMEL